VLCVCVYMLDVVYDYRAHICEVPVPVHFPAGDFGLLFSAFFTCVFYVRFVPPKLLLAPSQVACTEASLYVNFYLGT